MTDVLEIETGYLSSLVGTDPDGWDKHMTSEELDEFMKFNDSDRSIETVSFTAWTKDYVYFPLCSDGAEWVGHAPRNPCTISMEHQGRG